jgi:hypothetical protein
MHDALLLKKLDEVDELGKHYFDYWFWHLCAQTLDHIVERAVWTNLEHEIQVFIVL